MPTISNRSTTGQHADRRKTARSTAGAEYLGKQKGHWVAVPAAVGSQAKPPCARIDLFKQLAGLDVTKMYPAGAPPDKELADNWTWDLFLRRPRNARRPGSRSACRSGRRTDAVDWVGAVFAAHGAVLVDEEGNITVKSDATKQVLEWFKKIVPFLPPDVFAWDDAGNNKWLISGKGALIMNPPSAWAVAKRDAPQDRRAAVDLSTRRRAQGPLRPVPFPISGASGISRPTNRRRRAC